MAAKAALHALADHADENGLCWPSIARVALFMGASENTARRAIQRLADLGLVEREMTKGGAGHTNRFFLNFEWEPSQDDRDKPSQYGTLPNWNPPNEDEKPSQPDRKPSHVGTRTIKNHKEPSEGSKQHCLPADWQPDEGCVQYAKDLGLDPARITEAFVDHWTSNRGKKTKRGDWCRSWRVWCSKEIEWNPRPKPNGKGARPGDF